MALFPNEKLNLKNDNKKPVTLSDDGDINQKYARGGVKIVTQQARYRLPLIKDMVHDPKYELNPEFQRRLR